MAITSLNELWGKKWVLAENPTVMGGDYGQSYLKLNPAPAEPLHIAIYNYNYFSSDELYVEASTGNFLTFWGKHSTINAYGIPWESSTVTSFIIRTSTVWVEPKGATPRLMEFIDQPSGYSFEENALIVEFWNNNFVEVDEVVIDVKEEYEKLFESIGNSIRNKTGGSSKIYPTSIPAEIGKIGNSGATGTITITTNGTHDVAAYATANVNVPNTIPEGYIKPEGSLDITENGDYDVTTKVSVTVNVEGSGGGGDTSAEDGLIEGTLTSYTNDRVTKVRKGGFAYAAFSPISLPNATSFGDSAFYYATTAIVDAPNLTSIESACFNYSSLTVADFPKVTSIAAHAFSGCKKLTTVNFPKLTGVGGDSFRNCEKLQTASFPELKSIGSYVFDGCKALTSINVPKITSIGYNGLSNCYLLAKIDLPVTCTNSIQRNTFYNDYSLKTLVIRSATMVTLSNVNAFSSCYHFYGTTNSTYNPNGLKDGCIYVPDDLVDSYKAASNWSTFADCFKPLSEYAEE